MVGTGSAKYRDEGHILYVKPDSLQHSSTQSYSRGPDKARKGRSALQKGLETCI